MDRRRTGARCVGAWVPGARVLGARVLGALVLGALVLGAGCGRGEVAPEPLAVGQEACAFCRMTVSQPEFAAQLVVPGELPKFFDDLGCLQAYLTSTTPGPEGGVVFVADHRTRDWVQAEAAVFTRVAGLATPMGSHMVAHATAASRDADAEAAGGAAVLMDEVVPVAWQKAQGQ